ncbi:MAG: hypothetical protein L0212_04100 [Acidobacteria bacterium]|nr:hypothetical protein [Acidobacteriota bacterium]
MGVRLGSFPNALPATSARVDPRQSPLYSTLVRSPLEAPEGLGQWPRGAGGFVAPGGGIRLGLEPMDPTLTQASFCAWLDQELIPGLKNKFLAAGVLAYLVLRRR